MSLPRQEYRWVVTMTEPILGSQPGDKTLAQAYIEGKIIEMTGEERPSDEVLPDLDKGTTGFYRMAKDDDRPCLMDYQVKAFLKETGGAFNGHRGVKNLRLKVDNFVMVRPRKVLLHIPEGGGITYLERPLRGMGPLGPRTALARSEMLPEGTGFEVVLHVFEKGGIDEPMLRDLMEYGEYKGLGQWRNGGWGRFTSVLEKV